jgi:cholesterol transport system auxiliary component
VVIRYDAPLMQPHTQAILATRQFDIHKAVAGKAVPQMLVAFGQAADTLAAQVVDWVNSARSGER